MNSSSGPKTWSLELPYGLKKPKGPCLWILLIVIFVSSWASLAGAIELDTLVSIVQLVIICLLCYAFFIALSWYMITNDYCCFKILHTNPIYNFSFLEQVCLCQCASLARALTPVKGEDEDHLLHSSDDSDGFDDLAPLSDPNDTEIVF